MMIACLFAFRCDGTCFCHDKFAGCGYDCGCDSLGSASHQSSENDCDMLKQGAVVLQRCVAVGIHTVLICMSNPEIAQLACNTQPVHCCMEGSVKL